MSQLLYRFSFDSANTNKQVVLFAAIIWLVVMGCAIASIMGQSFSKKQRTFWLLVVFGLPLFGLLSYLPFSIRKENYPGLFNAKKKK